MLMSDMMLTCLMCVFNLFSLLSVSEPC